MRTLNAICCTLSLVTVLDAAGLDAQAPAPSRCAATDTLAMEAVRSRLSEWVSATNGGDRARSRDVWAPGVVGWFPTAAVFGDSAAAAVAGVSYSGSGPAGMVSYAIRIDDIVAAGPLVVVHDIWTERRRFDTNITVERVIRGSELWQCQPDGKWRIGRYVSAPELWKRN